MVEKIKGIVTAVSQKDGKYGIALGKDNWFNGYGECPCKKGDNVEVVYEVNKGFKNINQVYLDSQESKVDLIIEGKSKVICFEDMSLKDIVVELNKISTIATQFYPKGLNYDAIAWLK